MTEQQRKRMAVLERALLIAARMLMDKGVSETPYDEPADVVEWIMRKAREELRCDSEARMAEAIKKHPRGQ
jgi:hypothetical protein